MLTKKTKLPVDRRVIFWHDLVGLLYQLNHVINRGGGCVVSSPSRLNPAAGDSVYRAYQCPVETGGRLVKRRHIGVYVEFHAPGTPCPARQNGRHRREVQHKTAGVVRQDAVFTNRFWPEGCNAPAGSVRMNTRRANRRRLGERRRTTGLLRYERNKARTDPRQAVPYLVCVWLYIGMLPTAVATPLSCNRDLSSLGGGTRQF